MEYTASQKIAQFTQPKFKMSYLMKFIFIVFPRLGPILELQLKITGEQECPVMQ